MANSFLEEFDKFIEENIVQDELDGVERTLVEFNYNRWVDFKKNLAKKYDLDTSNKKGDRR